MARFTLPRDLYHGKGAMEALKTFEGKRAMICVGGGSMNGYLNELTAKRSGRKVMTGPVEATAIGNIIAQLLYDGAVKDINSAKMLVKDSFDVQTIG